MATTSEQVRAWAKADFKPAESAEAQWQIANALNYIAWHAGQWTKQLDDIQADVTAIRDAVETKF